MRRSTKPTGSFKKPFSRVRRYVTPLNLYLSAAVLVQIGYWYLGSPGPTLLNNAPRTLLSAVINIAWALLFLLVVPAALLLWRGDLGRTSFAFGNWRIGLPLTAGLGVVLAGVIYLGSGDVALQQTYPWAGTWPGMSVWHFAAWAGLYALYYVAFEFFYRGFVIVVLEPHWGLIAAVWTQVLLSTLIHVGKPLTETLAAFPAGFLFAFVALRTRSLLWPVLLHLVIGLVTDASVLGRQGLLW